MSASLVTYAAAQTSLFEVRIVLCCTVFLYSTVQTVHHTQTLELYTTEQLYAKMSLAAHQTGRAM